MKYNDALKRPCPHCGAAPHHNCYNTQEREVMPHKWRTLPSTAYLAPIEGLKLREVVVLDLARKQIALNGHTTAKELTPLYPTPSQYTSMVNALTRLTELGYLAIGATVDRSRTFTLGAK